MTNAQLGDLLEKAARRLRGGVSTKAGKQRRVMTAAELAKEAGVSPRTIRNYANEG